MKTLIIILCIVAAKTMDFDFDPIRYYKFHMNLCACETDWYATMKNRNQEPSGYLFKCATLKDGNIHNHYGQYSPIATTKFLENVIQDEDKIRKAIQIFNACYRKSYEQDMDMTTYISGCASDILSLIEKPQIESKIKYS